MKCPRCVQRVHRGAEECPHCGFTLAELDERFGAEEVRISRLDDGAGLMRRNERERVEEVMDRFERRFPQLFFAVHSGHSDGLCDLRRFGLWLLNRAAFEDVGVERPNERGVLLCIDPETKSAGLSWGYGLDPFLSEKNSFTMLSRAHAYFVEGCYSEGVVRVIEELGRLLKRRSHQARRDPERFEQWVARPTGSRFRRLRGARARELRKA